VECTLSRDSGVLRVSEHPLIEILEYSLIITARSPALKKLMDLADPRMTKSEHIWLKLIVNRDETMKIRNL
jgi:hypothetical protein